MNSFFLIASWLTPIILVPFLLFRNAKWLVPLAPIPALFSLFLIQEPVSLQLDWLLLGTYLGLDEIARWFLGGSVLVWFIAAIFAIHPAFWPKNSSKKAFTFHLFFLLAMAGNFLLILAMDMLTFYLGFALMGLSAFGLIVNHYEENNRRAAYLYLRWTIVGEVILFSAIVLLAVQADSVQFQQIKSQELSQIALLLVIIGFGIKIALPGLHLWLPQTYAVLPTAAAAVFSGPMISAGLLGMIRFLAHSEYVYSMAGMLLIGLGLFGAFYAVVVGLLQRHVKEALAYSSMSKMGWLAAALGLSLIYPQTADVLVFAIVLFAIHHLIVKSALFLGGGLLEQGSLRLWVIMGIAILCAALMGMPFTSGGMAKAELSQAIQSVTFNFHDLRVFYIWFSATSLLSVLLLGRIFYLMFLVKPGPVNHIQSRSNHSILVWVWMGMIGIVLGSPWLLDFKFTDWTSIPWLLTPLLIVFMVWISEPKFLNGWVGSVPPGDVLSLFKALGRRIDTRIGSTVMTTLKQGLNRQKHIIQVFKKFGGKRHGFEFSTASSGSLWVFIGALILMFSHFN